MKLPLGNLDDSHDNRDASDWLSDDGQSNKSPCSQDSDDEQAVSESRNHVSIRTLGWAFFLVVVAILSNLAVPITLDRIMDERYIPSPRPFPEGSVIEWVSYYSKTANRAFFFGLWFAEYVALWLWINSYVVSRTTRWLLGLFLSAAISYTVLLGMSIAWGPAPHDFFWFCLIGSLGLYATINLLLKLLLRRFDFRWQPIQLGTGSRYSIRALLGTMAGSAFLMLGLKLFPYNSASARGNSVLYFVPFAIWLAWLAIAIATLIWLQLGAVFSRRRGRFVISFVTLAIFGPTVFHHIGEWLLNWNRQIAFTIQFEQFVIAYSIELGLLVGVALVLPLLPRKANVAGQSSLHRHGVDGGGISAGVTPGADTKH